MHISAYIAEVLVELLIRGEMPLYTVHFGSVAKHAHEVLREGIDVVFRFRRALVLDVERHPLSRYEILHRLAA